MSEKQEAISRGVKAAWARRRMEETVNECFCIGPQNGEPLCPCRMKGLRIINGRYVETIDHGPAPKEQKE